MARKNTTPVRVDSEFKQMLNEIRMDRFRCGKDKEPKTTARLTLALTRVPNLKKILSEARIDD